MRLQWRRFKGAAMLSFFIGIVGIFLLVFGIVSGGATGIVLAVLGGVAIAGAAFDFYRMYGY
jgi:uncharacterized membrane protein